MLAAHAAGEKRREHPHYLKSTIFCGDCGSRLIVTNSKNRHGVVYPYFVCLGRQMKRTSCRRKAMLIATVERLVENYWATLTLDPLSRDELEAGIGAELAALRRDAERERTQLQTAKNTLLAKREKLVEAIYSGAVPMDLVASEQKQLSAQLAKIEERLVTMGTEATREDATLARVLNLMVDGHADYLAAEPLMRRLLNQAVFVRLYIDDQGARAEFARPFDVLMGPGAVQAAEVGAREQEQDATSSAAVLRRMVSDGNENALSLIDDRGADLEAKVRALAFGGLRADTLAGLRDSLSNIRPPLLRALELCEQRRTSNPKPRKYNTTKQIIAQTGVTDPTTVRLHVKENRKLSAAEVERLVQANKAGMPQAKLAKEFGMSLETVNRHLRRRRQSLVLGRVATGFRRTSSHTSGRSLTEEGGIAA